jgi:hypothetical protein
MTFQKIVLIVAILILIVILAFIAVSLRKAKKNTSWPPIIANCPDFWVSVADVSGTDMSDGDYCVNTKNLGKCPPKSGQPHLVMDFSKAPYTGTNGNCAKYTWATGCDISWDGITYGTSTPPCSTTSTSTSP